MNPLLTPPLTHSGPENEALSALYAENTRLRDQLMHMQQMALESKAREERLKHEIALMHELGEIIVSDLDLQRVLALVAQMGRELIQAETFLVPLLHANQDSYYYAEASGKDADDIRGTSFPIRIGMCGWVIQQQKPLLFGEPHDWQMDEKTHWETGQASAVLVPLLSKGRIIGGLSGIGKTGNGSFTRRDLELLTLFANQVSIAIENASLFNALKESVDSLEQRVEQRTRELIASNQELEAFSYSVSHDLRAPLRSIDGFSLALLEDCSDQLGSTAQTYLQRIRSNAQHMAKLIEALLKLSRLTRDDMSRKPPCRAQDSIQAGNHG